MTEESAYAASGVSVEAGKASVEKMQTAVEATYNDQVLTPLGSFGSAFALGQGYQDPVLISGTDGVGTKLLLTIAAQKYDTIGQDLVAMVMNDVLAQGAKSLFMLDHLAVDKMRPEVVATLVQGVAKATKAIDAALIGGESAELPGMYADNHYDLAGFGVGVVEREQLLSAEKAQAGDVLIGLPSSGLHSNGYSLVRQVLGLETTADWQALPESLQATLLEPTRLYQPVVEPLLNQPGLHSMAHITGGGIIENLPRAFGPESTAVVEWDSWPILPIFDLLQNKANLTLNDMFLPFNNGLGMVLVVSPDAADDVLQPREAESIIWKGTAPWPMTLN